jgi:molecular chaperone GrpE (heat shock protein)
MSLWGFFQKKEEKNALSGIIEPLQHRMSLHLTEQLEKQTERIYQRVHEQFAGTLEITNGLSQQISNLTEQIMKLTRMQYKTTQQLQGQLEEIRLQIDNIRQTQAEENANQFHALIEKNIRWLDDIDQLCKRLEGKETHMWQQTLRAWAEQLLSALAENGIHEIHVLGKSFQPQLAEAIGTVPFRDASENEATYVPYQVMDVVQRGFAYQDGRILRKAQVITLEPDMNSK